MRWYKDLYLGQSLKGKKLYYQYVIRFTKKITGTYCLMPAKHSSDLIDICHSELLRVEKFYPKDQFVIGIAGNYHEACLLAGEIVVEVLNKTGTTDVQTYFKQNMK